MASLGFHQPFECHRSALCQSSDYDGDGNNSMVPAKKVEIAWRWLAALLILRNPRVSSSVLDRCIWAIFEIGPLF
ncbi:hypothetical protein V6Z11_D08G209300 [Gossypium hirsutum]